MMTNIVWYLIIAFASNGGIATIPQPSREACTHQADYINNARYDSGSPGWAYCVYGVKQ